MPKTGRLLLITIITIAALGLATAAQSPKTGRAAPNGVMLTGAIRSDSGEKMEGVTVSAKGEGQTITTSVFSDEQGNYYFPALPAGKYRVWAQARGYQAGRAEPELEGAVRHQNFVLKTVQDFSLQLTADQWVSALPEDTPEHRRMKDVFAHDCTGCHQSSYILQNRFDEKGWEAILNLMSRVTGPEGLFGGPDRAPWPIIVYYKKALAAYLAEMRGPGPSPMEFKAPPRPKGEAALAVFTEYDIPVDFDGGYGPPANDGSDWSLGTTTRNNGNRGIHDAQFDLKGNIWFAYTEPSFDRTVGKVDAKTGKVTNIKVPGANGMAAASHGITIDRDGILWFNVSGATYVNVGGNFRSLARLDPNTEKAEVFTPPEGMSGVGGTLDVDGRGNIWAATRTGAVRFDPKTHQFKEFKSVTLKNPSATGTYGVTGDREGNGWWTQLEINLVSKGNIETGKSDEITMPVHKSRSDGILPEEDRQMYAKAGVPGPNFAFPWAEGPRRMAADKSSDVVWLCDYWGNNLAKIDSRTRKVMMMYPIPTPEAGPYSAAVDKNHNVWVNLTQADRVDRFDPKTEHWTEYPLPSLGAESRYVATLERNGRIQLVIPYSRISKVARMELRTKAELQALGAQVQAMARNR